MTFERKLKFHKQLNNRTKLKSWTELCWLEILLEVKCGGIHLGLSYNNQGVGVGGGERFVL